MRWVFGGGVGHRMGDGEGGRKGQGGGGLRARVTCRVDSPRDSPCCPSSSQLPLEKRRTHGFIVLLMLHW